ncbi:MAG: class I SAM-dependent DNA methyltransferase [Planctomycetota bacterium]
MKKSKKDISREVGLEIGSVCGRYFLKLEHLHYGYWTDGLEVDISSLRSAQDNYTEFLISHIPDGVKTILDVGCGTGGITKKLLERGYEPDCVSPSSFFVEQGRRLLGDRIGIFECRYEEVETEKRYDLILFAESFQYVALEQALQKTSCFLNNGGYMLICDIFRKDLRGKSRQRGGHELSKFRDSVAKYDFEPVEEVDITQQTAPTIEIFEQALTTIGPPILRSVQRFLSGRYPIVSRLLCWKYRKQLEKMHKKYFEGGRGADEFKEFKSYRLLLYRKAESSCPRETGDAQSC